MEIFCSYKGPIGLYVLEETDRAFLFLIPCHRVLGAGYKLVGYTGGLEVKVKLLETEGFFLG